MSDPKLISPLLDNFIIGDPISEHDGVLCCPAISKETDEKYIVKVISIPESQTQVDALLLSGAFADQDAVTHYFKSIADSIVEEIGVLQKLSQLEGFTSIDAYQVVSKDDGPGFDIYLLSAYRSTLRHLLRKTPLTHANVLNLGLDLCAALSVARRMGYMYVGLKPTNIYINESQEFRIGDLGFLSLSSLQYASLPERYNSEYTPPEVADAYSELNDTLDVYAVGLILYQIYNDGNLPEVTEGALPAPAYADAEMSAIILKACATTPAERWQDPVEMGQALVSYMQQKGAPDVLIIPADKPACNVNEGTNEDSSISEVTISEEAIYTDDNSIDESEIDYDHNSDDIDAILAQVDELIAHEMPSPVVQPEPIDIPIPQVVIPQEIEQDEVESEDHLDHQDTDETEAYEDFEDDGCNEEYDNYAPNPRKRHFGWIIWVLIVLILGMLTAGGFWGYNNYYLQNIDDIAIAFEDGGTLVVTISTDVNEKILVVSCTDIYGNTRRSPVHNGMARFTGLTADSAYNLKISISGFHKLTGKTTASFATQAQTEISNLSAITGKTDGSVLLTFAVEGPDAEQWNVAYKDASGAENNVAFTGHSVTVKGLTVGQEYAFTITPADDLNLIGKNTIKYVARPVIRAKNMVITGCYDNNLCVEWSADTDAYVESWTVHCYNESFDTTTVVKETSAIIKVPRDYDGYTVEITANEMTVSSTIKLPKGTTTITNFIVNETIDGTLNIRWEAGGEVPKNGFMLKYTVDGMSFNYEQPIPFEGLITINPVVPGSKYTFEFFSTSDVPIIYRCSTTYVTSEAKRLDKLHEIGVSGSDITFSMCLSPEDESWRDVPKTDWDIRPKFTTAESISLIGEVAPGYDETVDKTINAVFVIRNAAGEVVGLSQESMVWNDLVEDGLFKLDLPDFRSVPGKYTVTLLLNNSDAYSREITIIQQ